MRLMLAVSAFALLAACKAQAPADNQSASADTAAAAAAVTTSAVNPNAPLGAAVSGEQAKTIMHERHEGMEKIGKATKAVGRELKSGSPNVATVREAAATIADLSAKTSGWFAPGTGPDVGKTGAKAEIWQNPKDVAEKDRAFQKAAQAFNAAAASGDLTRIKEGFSDLGETCKACHDKYRKEMKH